jgi:hypothetical protein
VSDNSGNIRLFSSLAWRRSELMKQLNVWPMVILLIVVVALVIWLRPH